MFFRGCDGHTIFDINSGVVLNKSKPIVIGDHVWVGVDAIFLKGCEIPNITIVGTGSIASRKYSEQSTVIAGRPASVVKTGVNWDRSYIHVYEKIGSKCSLITSRLNFSCLIVSM